MSKTEPGFTGFGRICYYLGMIRLYQDGDGFSYVFRKWHPLTWLLWIVALPMCGIVGERIADVIPTSLPPYWDDKTVQWYE